MSSICGWICQRGTPEFVSLTNPSLSALRTENNPTTGNLPYHGQMSSVPADTRSLRTMTETPELDVTEPNDV